jgi:hypothetical protein
MKIVFFTSEDFSPCLGRLEELRRVKPINLVLHLVRKGGFELVVALVEDEASYDHLMRFLYDCGIDYVYEMEGGIPKVLKYVRTRLGGAVVVEAKFA